MPESIVEVLTMRWMWLLDSLFWLILLAGTLLILKRRRDMVAIIAVVGGVLAFAGSTIQTVVLVRDVVFQEEHTFDPDAFRMKVYDVASFSAELGRGLFALAFVLLAMRIGEIRGQSSKC